MLPKSYTVFKWLVYALATLLLFSLQSLLLNRIRVLNLLPFLYPVLPAVAAMYEGPRRGPVFGLCLGVVCDLLLPAPFSGFFTLAFPVTAIVSAYIAENFISPNFLCALVVSACGLLVTAGFRMLAEILSGGGDLPLMARTAAIEAALTMPFVLLVMPVYRGIHRRCGTDY